MERADPTTPAGAARAGSKGLLSSAGSHGREREAERPQAPRMDALDPSYLEYWSAAHSGKGKEEIRQRIDVIPEEKRYLTRVLDSLDGAFAEFDSETARLDLPHMKARQPEAIKRYLEIRLKRLTLVGEAVDEYIEKQRRTAGGRA